MTKLARMIAILLTGLVLSAASPPANLWEIGPIINGRNYSHNMPLRPDESRDGPSFEIPGPSEKNGHVHYLTLPVRSLEGANGITLRYRIDAKPGTRFVPQEHPDRTAILSLYFQRRGDSWTARHPDYRWYAPRDRAVPITPGVHEIRVDFDENWKAMTKSTRNTNRRGFEAALANAHRVGFTFGSDGGRGHGVYATGPARFTILDFRID